MLPSRGSSHHAGYSDKLITRAAITLYRPEAGVPRVAWYLSIPGNLATSLPVEHTKYYVVPT
jgi:hypothetical protein